MQKKDSRKSDKKLVLISIITLFALAIFGLVFYKILSKSESVEREKMVLASEFKNTNGEQIKLSEKTTDDEFVEYFENLVKEKKDFVLYVALPFCSGDSAKFKEYVLDFQRKNHLSFYYLTSDYVKDTSVYETVKYFPAVIIYKDGKILNYLKYDSDEDVKYYKSYDGFSKWMRENVEF